MSLKVLLITPPYHCGALECAGTWLPTGFVYLAGSLRKGGYQVEIYDAMSKFHTHDDIGRHIEHSQPDVVAVGAITATINDSLKVLKLAKNINPEVLTILGNVHPTFCWEEVLQENHDAVDFIIRSEGEEGIVDLLNGVVDRRNPAEIKGIAFWEDGKAIATPERAFVEDLDSLPTAWDLIEWKDYTYYTKPGSTLAVVCSSRGCTHNCSFCSQRLFWKQHWRARSPGNFVAELEYLNKVFGVNVAMISDEMPTFDRDRWERILDLLIDKKLDLELLMETRVDDIVRDKDILDKYRRAGIVHIYVGVEAASQETLDHFKKGIKIEESKKALQLINEADIISETSFVLGMPHDTKESIKKTVELAKYYDPDMAFFLGIAPWPYAEIYQELKPYIEIFDYSSYNLVQPVVKPINMTLEELNKELGNAAREFYMFKLSKLDEMSPFKREFMLAVVDLIVNNSYLAEQMMGLKDDAQGMPSDIMEFLANLSTKQPSKECRT